MSARNVRCCPCTKPNASPNAGGTSNVSVTASRVSRATDAMVRGWNLLIGIAHKQSSGPADSQFRRSRENEPEGRSFEERPSGNPVSLDERRWIPAEAYPRMLESGAGMTPVFWNLSHTFFIAKKTIRTNGQYGLSGPFGLFGVKRPHRFPAVRYRTRSAVAGHRARSSRWSTRARVWSR